MSNCRREMIIRDQIVSSSESFPRLKVMKKTFWQLKYLITAVKGNEQFYKMMINNLI